jgi:putative two-component system response regulator
MLRALLEGEGWKVEAVDEPSALLEGARRRQPALALVDFHLEGPEVCRALKSNETTARTVVVLLTATPEERRRALQAGADEILTRPFESAEVVLRVRGALERHHLARDVDSLEKLLLSVISSLEAREEGRFRVERVARMARRLGQRLKLEPQDVEALYKGALLRDIGMLKVSRSIVDKPGTLTSEEFELMKQHTLWGEALCRPVRAFRRLLPIIRHHHEQMDGRGYPDGLQGSEVPFLARIIAVVELYDALSSDRPYRRRLPPNEVVRHIREYGARQWLDPQVVAEFLAMLDEEGYPDVVAPADGRGASKGSPGLTPP